MRIKWHLMHVVDYGGNCVFCGGECQNPAAIRARREALEELEHARAAEFSFMGRGAWGMTPEQGRRRAEHIRHRIAEKQNFYFV